MVAVEVDNRSGWKVDEQGAISLAQRVLAAEGVDEGELGIHFVEPDEIQRLKHEHLGIDEATDALAFPIDERERVPEGLPRQLGDAIVCPQVVGEQWREPLVHALLHLLGHDHGPEMEARERMHRE
ncbi:MAG: rRNA maturation RNase YbeY [Actinobacteria bacterium]|nr:rRNA maturation RNase YbeY [Actinomycetota bacterium]